MIQQHSITQQFTDSCKNNISAISKDLAEIGLDTLLDDGIFKDIPFVNTMVSLYKTGKSVTNIFYVKKLIAFLNSLSELDIEKRQNFIDNDLNTQEKKEKFTETFLLLIEKSDDISKVKLCSKIIEYHILEKCTYSEMVRVSKMVDKVFYSDLEHLVLFEDGNLENQIITDELYKNGFLSYGGTSGGTFGGSLTENGGMIYNINRYGEIVKDILSSGQL
jgi:hypothetical protein